MLHVSLTLPRFLIHDVLDTLVTAAKYIYDYRYNCRPQDQVQTSGGCQSCSGINFLKVSVSGLTIFPLSLGTLILVLVGNGAMAQAVLSLNTKGNFFSVNFG